jgi:hypothetical protein
MSGEPKSLNPDAPEFIPGSEPPKRDDSGKLPRYKVHYRYNCASSFQSLASHLNEIMNTPGTPPDKAQVLEWIQRCIDSRIRKNNWLKSQGELLDESHEVVLTMLNTLHDYVRDEIREGSSASFEFFENPLRFIVRSEGIGVAVFVGRVQRLREVRRERRWGGRKSTRKHRKSKRKTYRILPRVEGS